MIEIKTSIKLSTFMWCANDRVTRPRESGSKRALRWPRKMGFAKSKPAARDGPAARRPGGPRPTAHGPRPTAHGPRPTTARLPSPDFPQLFCPVVTPSAGTDLHLVWACKIDDGDFEFGYHSCRPMHVGGFTAGQKTVENQDWASAGGRRAARSSRAVGCGPLACF